MGLSLRSVDFKDWRAYKIQTTNKGESVEKLFLLMTIISFSVEAQARHYVSCNTEYTRYYDKYRPDSNSKTEKSSFRFLCRKDKKLFGGELVLACRNGKIEVRIPRGGSSVLQAENEIYGEYYPNISRFKYRCTIK